MMSTAVDKLPWVLTSDGRFHLALGNLPLAEPWESVTVCHVRGSLSRTGLPPSPRLRHRVCAACVAEIESMGETVPAAIRPKKVR